MGSLSFARYFRLRPGAIECAADGLRVGGVALLARDAKGAWTKRDGGELNRELSKLYGLPLDCERKGGALDAVAAALTNGELARAQIGTLLLRLPDPPASADVHADSLEMRRLVDGLLASGLLKMDADWDEKHPRTGAPPNPGWFAPTSAPPAADEPKPDASPAATGPSRGGAALGFVASAPAAGVDSLLAEDLSAAVLEGLATLAARFSAATILFDAIFVPSDNRLVEEGFIPGRPDIVYRWSHSEGERAVTLKVLVDGQWRTLAVGGAAPDGLVFDQNDRVVARVVSGPDQRQTLVATVDALDRAVDDLRREDGEPVDAPVADDHEPKLCPDPSPEPRTTDSANSIAYQEYVSGLPYPWAIFFGGLWFDGCDPPTGDLLDAKGNIDFMFDENDKLNEWINPKKNPAIQMTAQAKAAAAVGRFVVWHAQTEKGYRGLTKIAKGLPFRNLSVDYDPN